MPLTLNCPKCKTPFRVRDEAMGQKVKCPTCQAVLSVPANIGPASVLDIPTDIPPSRPHGGMGAPPPVSPRPIPESIRMMPGDDAETLSLQEDFPSLEKHLAANPPQTRGVSSPGRTAGMPNLPPREEPPRPGSPPKRRPSTGVTPDSFRGWKNVAGALRLLQVASWFALVPLICETGKHVYFLTRKDLPDATPGFLGLGNFWMEVALLYTLIPFLLVMLLFLMGRISLTKVPATTDAKGLATGSMLMTLFSFFGFLGLMAVTILGLMEILGPREKIFKLGTNISLGIGIVFGLLAELWFLLFLGQVGPHVRQPKMSLRVGWFFVFFVMLAAIPFIVQEFYPLYLSADEVLYGSRNLGLQEGYRRLHLNQAISSGVMLAQGLLLILAYVRLIGKVRRATWVMIEEKQPVMVMMDR